MIARSWRNTSSTTLPAAIRSMFKWQSTLAAAFDKPHKSRTTKDLVGLLAVERLQRPSDFEKWQKDSIEESNRLIADIIATPPSLKTVELFDQLSNEICLLADLTGFVRMVHPLTSIVAASENACMSMLSLVSQLNANVDLYKALLQVVQNKNLMADMDEDSRIVARLLLNDLMYNGVHLNDEQKKEKVKLDMKIVSLCDKFITQSHAPSYIPIDQCPDYFLSSHILHKDGNYVKVTYPHHDSTNEDLREFAYKAYYARNDKQENMLTDLLTSRYNMAKFVGYQSYAHQCLLDTMVQSPETALSFLKATAAAIKDKAEKETKQMLELKRSDCLDQKKELMQWDLNYYIHFKKKQPIIMSNAEIAAHFSVGTCMEGLNTIFNSLYNVSLIPLTCGRNELWADDVVKLGVVDNEEGLLGHIYCDFYARPKKLNVSDTQHTITAGKLLNDGSYQTPVVGLTCNFPSPTVATPTFLSYAMMMNLFHEMGHAMHSIFGRTRYQHVSGTRCATDFAEVPSLLMEYFAADPRVLATVAKHYKTGSALPEVIVDHIISTSKNFVALDLQQHLCMAIIDLLLYSQHSSDKSTTDIVKSVYENFSSIPHVENTAWHLRFAHLTHYGAKYYSYIWSRAIASLIWRECFSEDPFSRSNGEKYRRKILAYGGGRSPKLMIEDLLSKELCNGNLVESIAKEVNSCQLNI